MAALLIGAAVTIIAAFGAAWLGARLQRKWTPNPIPSIDAIGGQISELQKQIEATNPVPSVEALGGRITELRHRMEAIEDERIEAEHFTLGMQLRQASGGNNYILDVRNDTNKDVLVETVQFFRGEAPLSDSNKKPNPSDDWCIPAHSGKQLWWSPQPDPVSTLIYSEPNLPHGMAIPVRIVLVCASGGKPRVARRTVSVTVDFRNRTLTQYGP